VPPAPCLPRAVHVDRAFRVASPAADPYLGIAAVLERPCCSSRPAAPRGKIGTAADATRRRGRVRLGLVLPGGAVRRRQLRAAAHVRNGRRAPGALPIPSRPPSSLLRQLADGSPTAALAGEQTSTGSSTPFPALARVAGHGDRAQARSADGTIPRWPDALPSASFSSPRRRAYPCTGLGERGLACTAPVVSLDNDMQLCDITLDARRARPVAVAIRRGALSRASRRDAVILACGAARLAQALPGQLPSRTCGNWASSSPFRSVPVQAVNQPARLNLLTHDHPGPGGGVQ